MVYNAFIPEKRYSDISELFLSPTDFADNTFIVKNFTCQACFTCFMVKRESSFALRLRAQTRETPLAYLENEGGSMPEKNSAGKNVESYCGKCKGNLDHTIMTMDGDAIGKVRCKACGGLHKFRNPADPVKVRKPRVKNPAGEEAAAAIIWETGLAAAKGKERDYSMAIKYRVGDIVNHNTFGKGIVLKLYANKCDMLFKDRERLMASTNE